MIQEEAPIELVDYMPIWLHTQMKCDSCGHEWVAVHVYFTALLECPACMTYTLRKQGVKQMTIQTFLIEMDDEARCEYCAEYPYTNNGEPICTKIRYPDTPCWGDLEKRPEGCPLVPLRKPNNNDIKSYKETWVEE